MKILLLLLTTMFSFNSFSYEKKGFYKINDDGWAVAETPIGEVFACKDCDSVIEVQISYGIEFNNNEFYKSNGDFINAMKNPVKQENFIKLIIEETIPTINPDDIKIVQTNPNYKISGYPFLEYKLVVKQQNILDIMESSYIAVQRSRILKISANFLLGKVSESDLKRMNIFLNSFSPL